MENILYASNKNWIVNNLTEESQVNMIKKLNQDSDILTLIKSPPVLFNKDTNTVLYYITYLKTVKNRNDLNFVLDIVKKEKGIKFLSYNTIKILSIETKYP
jgi:hypothetical protein